MKQLPCNIAKLDDRQIRTALRRWLLARRKGKDNFLLVEELSLFHGETRVDIAVVSSALRGYEIKSDRDTLFRFPDQVRRYSAILDSVILVSGMRHCIELMRDAPDWWGVMLAEYSPRGIRFSTLRDPSRNPYPDPVALASLLWKEEALAVLEELGAADGVRSKPRRAVYHRLVEAIPTHENLRRLVCSRLRERLVQRSAQLRG